MACHQYLNYFVEFFFLLSPFLFSTFVSFFPLPAKRGSCQATWSQMLSSPTPSVAFLSRLLPCTPVGFCWVYHDVQGRLHELCEPCAWHSLVHVPSQCEGEDVLLLVLH